MAAGVVTRAEPGTTWLLVGLIALAFAFMPLWIRYGGSPSGPLPALPADPVAVLEGGQKIAFAAGDLVTGDGLLCENQGVRVGGWVPRPGRTTYSRFVGSEWTASMRIHTRTDGAVIVHCS